MLLNSRNSRDGNNSAVGSIVFIDPAVEDYQTLAAGVFAGVEAIALDPSKDGIEQITEILSRRKNISNLHIVSNGQSGKLYLGLAEYVRDRSHANGAIAIIMGDFYDNNRLIYGDVGEGNIYEATFDQNRNITGTRVFDSGLPNVVDMEKGPDGNMYGVNLGNSTIFRWVPA